MSTSNTTPCRLFLISAREAPIVVIFRRGPSKWTHIIKWNTNSDTFEFGTWFQGQFYPQRCDISPDGTKLIYFAANYQVRNRNKGFPEAWTAVSRVPWSTALAVWPNIGTYYGGGLFEANDKVWVNCCGVENEIKYHPAYPPKGLEASYEHLFWDHNWHCMFRLERDGWKPIQEYARGSVPAYHLQKDGSYIVKAFDPSCSPLTKITAIHEKQAKSTFHLVMTSTFDFSGGEDKQTFALRNSKGNTTPLEDVVWADWDKKDRLLCAKEGKLFAVEIGDKEKLHFHELADFNSLQPAHTPAPMWAREW